jgi:hypothetical protein
MANGAPDIYPQAYLAMGNGDLVEVTDFTVSLSNGAKLHHTLRKPGAGIIFGPPGSQVSFNAAVPETGPERNYWKDCLERNIKQIRAKLPGGKTTLVINGAFSEVNLDGPLDDATKVACTFVGKMDKPEI